jgi:hypothetical protein
VVAVVVVEMGAVAALPNFRIDRPLHRRFRARHFRRARYRKGSRGLEEISEFRRVRMTLAQFLR